MKTWTTPVMQELDVMLTASSGFPGATEAAGYLQDGWHNATYDASIYEKESEDATCTVPISSSACATSLS